MFVAGEGSKYQWKKASKPYTCRKTLLLYRFFKDDPVILRGIKIRITNYTSNPATTFNPFGPNVFFLNVFCEIVWGHCEMTCCEMQLIGVSSILPFARRVRSSLSDCLPTKTWRTWTPSMASSCLTTVGRKAWQLPLCGLVASTCLHPRPQTTSDIPAWPPWWWAFCRFLRCIRAKLLMRFPECFRESSNKTLMQRLYQCRALSGLGYCKGSGQIPSAWAMLFKSTTTTQKFVHMALSNHVKGQVNFLFCLVFLCLWPQCFFCSLRLLMAWGVGRPIWQWKPHDWLQEDLGNQELDGEMLPGG